MTITYRSAAEALWGEAGAYAHHAYTRLRTEHLPALPAELPIVIGITAYGHCLGLTRSDWEDGPRITLASNLFAAGHRRVDDTLLHEMVHAALILAGRNPAHDAEPWYDTVRRLSPTVLGHDLEVRRGGDRKSVRVPNPLAGEDGQPATVVRKVRVESSVSHGDVARWPYSFRPTDFDCGAPISCPSY